MMEIKAVISKEDIAVLGALEGRANESTFSVESGEFARGRIIFHGFAGALDTRDHQYHGVVRLEPCAQPAFSNVGDFSPVARAMELLHRDDRAVDTKEFT